MEGMLMKNEKYLEVFREIVRLEKQGKLVEGIEGIRLKDMDEELLRGYIASALGQEPDENVSLREIAEKALKDYEGREPIITLASGCEDCNEEKGGRKCIKSCPFDAMFADEDAGKVKVHMDKCEGCGECVEACDLKKIVDKIQYMPIANLLRDRKTPVYATIAPAYVGQFGENATPGRLRTAVKMLGFKDLIEVAIFADIISIKEAVAFDRLVKKQGDFMITSCCCPVWMALLKKHYNDLVKHVSPSVSPMIASGRVIKKIDPDARVVFIGPCVAKKSEAREKDLLGDIDYVMTFDEFAEVLKASEIKLEELDEEVSDCASRGGRIYARTGGVSQCIEETLEKLGQDRDVYLKAVQGNGVLECRKLLDGALRGEIDANFLEGMGCVGGCVGGPKVVIDKELGRELVNEYGEEAEYGTPLDNSCLLRILKSIGINSIHEVEEGNDNALLFSRDL
jgi:iron only hydrogenase large subunit-like protein